MNDPHNNCESWSEPISLAAAGCLDAGEEAELHRHLAECSHCRERYRQLAGLCDVLAGFQEPARGVEEAVVRRVVSAITPVKPSRSGGRRVWLSIAAAVVAASLILAVEPLWNVIKPPRQPASIMPPIYPEPKAVGQEVSLAARPPTLMDYDRAIAQSDDAPQRLLAQDAERIGILFDHTPTVSIANELELLQ
jgi:hypothetical protein